MMTRDKVCVITNRVKPKRKKKRGVDVNAEIPFEKRPAPGEFSLPTLFAKPRC